MIDAHSLQWLDDKDQPLAVKALQYTAPDPSTSPVTPGNVAAIRTAIQDVAEPADDWDPPHSASLRIAHPDGNTYTLEPEGYIVLFPQDPHHGRALEIHTAAQFATNFTRD